MPQGATPDSATNNKGGANSRSSPTADDQAKEQAKKVVEQTQKAGEVLDQAKNQTKSWAEDRKQAVAQSLSDIAVAVMQTGDSLRGQNPDTGNIADMTDRAAEAADKFAGYLRDTSVDQMIGEVESFGRREPVLFLFGAAAIGFSGGALPEELRPERADRARIQPRSPAAGAVGQSKHRDR